ncbi:reverse transcriptase [bacterium]|nr:reverse transcriptase [bacterium]
MTERAFLSPSNIFKAYIDCRKRKRSTVNAQKFERNLCTNIVSLTKSLQSGEYTPGKSICFVVRNPKPREVFAADFKDRIVHHLVVRFLEQHWEKVFIHDSYACRRNKGTLAAVERVAHNMRSITQNGKKRAYFMQLDVKNFFMSIDREILWNLLEKGLKKQLGIRKNAQNCPQTTIFDLDSAEKEENFEQISKIMKTLLFHEPTRDYINKSTKREWSWVPPEKSLFNAGDGKGLPIGNLTSQFFANVYLNELDQFIKHVLKIKYYVRYVDDFVIMHEDKEQLRKWLAEIKEFLKERLGITLKNAVKVAPLSNGINFLGYVQHIFYRLVRRRVVNNFRNKLRELENPSQSLLRQAQQPTALPNKGEPRKNLPLTQGEVSRSDGEGKQFFALLTKIRSVLTSYLAYSSKANSFRIVVKTLHPHQWLKQFFRLYRTKAAFIEEITLENKGFITNFF